MCIRDRAASLHRRISSKIEQSHGTTGDETLETLDQRVFGESRPRNGGKHEEERKREVASPSPATKLRAQTHASCDRAQRENQRNQPPTRIGLGDKPRLSLIHISEPTRLLSIS